MSNKNYIVGIYENRVDANEATERLHEEGFSREAISVLVAQKSAKGHFGFEENKKLPEGAAIGGAAGVGLGAIVAGLATVGAIALPGGAVVAAGPLVAALAGAGAGGAGGGLVGGLIGLGFSEAEAKFYEKNLDAGNILLAVEYETSDEKTTIREVIDDTSGKRANAAA